MFGQVPAFSTFSVDDLEKAKAFYGTTLGLAVAETPGMEGTLDLQLGNGVHVGVYPKDDHVPATFTVLNFLVDDIDASVDALTGRGVRFEHYEGELATDARGVHRDDGPPIAWFTDPAGNVLSVIESDGPPFDQ